MIDRRDIDTTTCIYCDRKIPRGRVCNLHAHLPSTEAHSYWLRRYTLDEIYEMGRCLLAIPLKGDGDASEASSSGRHLRVVA